MAVTEAQARAYVDVDVDLTDYLTAAEVLLVGYLGEEHAVPDAVLDNATLQLVQELYLRRRSPGGIVTYGGEESIARLNRDPMVSIYPLLANWAEKAP